MLVSDARHWHLLLRFFSLTGFLSFFFISWFSTWIFDHDSFNYLFLFYWQLWVRTWNGERGENVGEIDLSFYPNEFFYRFAFKILIKQYEKKKNSQPRTKRNIDWKIELNSFFFSSFATRNCFSSTNIFLIKIKLFFFLYAFA